MERNRVLWVIFSVSLFLVVVLAAALYFLRPKTAAGPEVAARAAPSMESFDVFEYVRGRSGLPGLAEEPRQGDEMVIIVGEPEQPAEQREGAVSEIPVARDIVPAPPVAAPSRRVAGPGAPAERPSPRQAAKPAPRPAPRPAPKPAPRPVRVTEYWIQVGSFSSRSRADELSRSLAERGLAPKLTTRSVSGTTHFRVRLGPYASRGEAAKFLDWIRALEGLENSYISMVTVQRLPPVEGSSPR